jgi:mediator of RNA polymerase II transcription subunit 16
MILGNAKWTLDFSHFILSEILDLAAEFEDVFNDQEAFTQKRKSYPSYSPSPPSSYILTPHQ